MNIDLLSGEKYQIRRLNFFHCTFSHLFPGTVSLLNVCIYTCSKIFKFMCYLVCCSFPNFWLIVVFFSFLNYLLFCLYPSHLLINSHSLVYLLLLQCPSIMCCLQFTLLSCFTCSHSFTFPFHYFICNLLIISSLTSCTSIFIVFVFLHSPLLSLCLYVQIRTPLTHTSLSSCIGCQSVACV